MEKSAYEILNNLQFNHWWFTGRTKIINSLLKNNIKKQDINILDVGSGYGSLVPTLKNFGEVECVEPFVDSKDFLFELGAKEVYNFKGFPQECPEKKYDLVTFFDVVEHIEDDKNFLQGVRDNVLKDDGQIVITVPAYQWLWTHHDEEHKHYRRYTLKRLKRVVESCGYSEIKVSYFMTLLFPLAVISRLSQKILKSKSTDLKETNKILNKIMFNVFSFEKNLINKIQLPYGLSLVLIAKK